MTDITDTQNSLKSNSITPQSASELGLSEDDLMRPFGEWLAEQRNKSGFSLQVISQRTMIPESTIRALESCDITQHPPRAFALGFLRTLAGVIGINPLEVLTRYDYFASRNGRPSTIPVSAVPSARVEDAAQPEEDGANRWLDHPAAVAAALVALLAAVVICLSVGSADREAAAQDMKILEDARAGLTSKGNQPGAAASHVAAPVHGSDQAR